MRGFIGRAAQHLGPLALMGPLVSGLLLVQPHIAFGTDDLVDKAFEPEGANSALVVPLVDPARGRVLFVSKGCVLCHRVNGVGGLAAPALDAPGGDGQQIDPFEFMSRMWRGAKAMIALQDLELGYQIELSGEEIAALTGFAYDAREQGKLTIDQVPPDMREGFIDEPFDGWVGLPSDTSERRLAER